MQEISVDIRPAHLAIVQKVLHDVLPRDVRVWVFGSRAKWTTKDSSDLDIAIDAGRPLVRREESALTDAFEESDLPYKVDFVDLNTVSSSFREIIERDKVELPSPIKSDWQIYYLEETGRIVTGKTPSTAEKENFGGNVPFITPTDMKDQKYISETQRYLTEQGQKAVKGSVLPPKSVMVSCIGSDMGKVAINRRQSVTNQQINTIIPNENFDADFLYYSLKPRKAELQALATSGSAQPILNKGHFSKITINAPILIEQRAIAAVLGALDDKIELNRRMNATLEAMARALFKSWFVDFDPVRAKMEGKQPFGMDAATAALFPSRLVPSPLGDIPERWMVSDLGSEFDVTMGQSPPGETYNENGEGLPFYQGRTDFGSRYPTRRIFCTQPNRIAETGDTLISVRAPVGDINMALEKCILGRGVGALRHKSKGRSYTYYAVNSVQPALKAFEADGTVFGSINKQDVAKISIVKPDDRIIERFENIAHGFDEKILSQTKEISELEKTRDYLLPKLISGDIRIRDAEKLVEAA